MSRTAVDIEPAPLPARKSLRAKALAATVALLLYLLGSVAYVTTERARIYDGIQRLELVSRHEKTLALTEASVGGAIVDVNLASNASAPEPALPEEIRLYMETCTKLFEALDEFDPRYALISRAITRSYAALERAPVRANWIDLRESLRRAADELEIHRGALVEQRDRMNRDYQRQYDTMTIKSLLLSLFGIAAFGAVVAWFFARLTGDIGRLEVHARRIVRGGRGIELPVGREDELGRLMHAVNRMSAELDQHEKQIELEGQRRSHQDKMLAVGALAAGVAHEINNPLTVIAGVAQELKSSSGDGTTTPLADAARLILAQTQRASQAARNLADLAAPQPTEFDWVDVNALVRRVLQLMAYDRRYRHITLDAELAPDVPAVRAVGAAMQQVLMQLLTLGCDALGPATTPRSASVQTLRAADAVDVVLDFPVRLDFTRQDVQRALLMIRATIEPMGARLALSQDEDPAVRVKLCWPVDPGGA
ncbi:MAG: HAMP domain-containing protein [Rhizobacter sp.]|nr:HAMP domain-containing protein [Rhizobacter sp.]